MIGHAIAAAAAAVAPAASPQGAIAAAMAASAAAWNRGDLAGFVAVYAPDATYVAGDAVVRGKAAIAARYAKSFTGNGNARGALSFRPLAWRALGAERILLVARWTLTPAGGAQADTGLTSLVFERRAGGWLIVADHSS